MYEKARLADERSFASRQHAPREVSETCRRLEAERGSELDSRRARGEDLVDVAGDLFGRAREGEAVEEVVRDLKGRIGQRGVESGDHLEVALHHGQRACSSGAAIL